MSCDRETDNRFIPAHAGNTRSAGVGSPNGSVHPRARGEHLEPLGWTCDHPGSSPRTRGTHISNIRSSSSARFIPAHAGNTGWVDAKGIGFAVHPRARGEHVSRASFDPVLTGSSPRTRGTLFGILGSKISFRFIPAHAGNTPAPRWGAGSTTVHPRARGEHGEKQVGRVAAIGSSPRTRGTRCCHRRIRCD